MSDCFDQKQQYFDLYEYLSTVTWMHYEEARKRGRDHKGYVYFFGRTLHRLFHPLYFFHQKTDPNFRWERENFDTYNPEETFTSWPEKKAFLSSKFREKKLEIYSREFTQKVVAKYGYQAFRWLVKNHHLKILEFDPHLGFYLDILDWTEEYFLTFLGQGREKVESLQVQNNSSLLPVPAFA